MGFLKIFGKRLRELIFQELKRVRNHIAGGFHCDSAGQPVCLFFFMVYKKVVS